MKCNDLVFEVSFEVLEGQLKWASQLVTKLQHSRSIYPKVIWIRIIFNTAHKFQGFEFLLVYQPYLLKCSFIKIVISIIEKAIAKTFCGTKIWCWSWLSTIYKISRISFKLWISFHASSFYTICRSVTSLL